MPSPDEHAQPGSWRDGLTPKQILFVENYLTTLNGTKAAIAAGYSEKSASVIAYENLRKPQIALAIDKALAAEPGVTRSRIVDELARIAFADPRNIASWDGQTLTVKNSEEISDETASAISEISQTRDGIRIKMNDKVAALDRLGRATRLFADKLELTGRDGEPLVPQDAGPREIARAIMDLFRTLSLEGHLQQDDEMEPAGSCPSPAAPTTRARAPSGASASTGAASEPDDRPGNPMPRLSPKRKTITRKSKSTKVK